MTFNTAIAEDALAYIRDHPEEWNQTVWWCGSAACFAGHVVQQAGATRYGSSLCMLNDQPTPIMHGAAKLLGLTVLATAPLFQANNTMAILEGLVKYLSNNPDAEPNQIWRERHRLVVQESRG